MVNCGVDVLRIGATGSSDSGGWREGEEAFREFNAGDWIPNVFCVLCLVLERGISGEGAADIRDCRRFLSELERLGSIA